MKMYAIEVADKKIEQNFRALWVVNEFKRKGYNSRSKFMEKVLNEYPQFKSYEPIRKLTLFWLLRSHDYLDELELLAKRL